MACCTRCNAKIGMFARAFKRADAVLCKSCLAPWYDDCKRAALASLCDGGDPVEIFSIPLVKCRDPDIRDEWYRLVGNLAFTDKGICFVQVASYRHRHSGFLVLLGFLILSFVGDLISHAVAAKEAAMERQSVAAGQSAMRGARSFKERLERSPRLIVFPLSQITDVTYGWWNGFRVHAGKRKVRFLLQGEGEEFKLRRRDIEKFLERVGNDYQRLSMH